MSLYADSLCYDAEEKMKSNSRICAVIDLDAVVDNINLLTSKLEAQTKLLAVIKADGYGHGAVPIAETIDNNKRIWGFGVATASEALELRRAQIKKPILLLGYTFEEDYEDVIKYNLTPTIFAFEQVDKLAKVAHQANVTVNIHLAIDTGMNRIGFSDDDESVAEIARIINLENIFVEGIFTHFARADELEKAATQAQLKRFEEFVTKLAAKGITIPVQHCNNSAGLIQFPEANKQIVRAGIVIYGLYPSKEMAELGVKLKPAMSITSHITHLKTIKTGAAVSYGGSYVADKVTKVATIPVGYADGYARSLSNKGHVLINGCKAPIIGRICMDQLMVDASKIPDVKVLDEVVMLGNSGSETITMEDLGELSDKFNYEFACGISKRVRRIYKNDTN